MIGDWYGINVCSKCNERLFNRERMNSGGICPKCGHNSRGTICDTEKLIIRQVLISPKYKFWNKNYRYEGMNPESKKWLENF